MQFFHSQFAHIHKTTIRSLQALNLSVSYGKDHFILQDKKK